MGLGACSDSGRSDEAGAALTTPTKAAVVATQATTTPAGVATGWVCGCACDKSNPPVHVACVVLATTRLDVNRVVRTRLGVKKASFCAADETREITGMEIGGVTAVGLPAGLPIWIDAAVMRRERIVLGGGSRNWKVRCAPAGLLLVPGVEVVEGLAAPAG